MKCQKNILFFFLSYSFFKLTFEQIENPIIFDDEANIKTAYVGNDIVYIVNKPDNTTIGLYKKGNISNHDAKILNYKDILKKNDSSFIIIGSNDDTYNNLCFQIFSIQSNIVRRETTVCPSISFSNLFKMEARYIENNVLIIYTIEARDLFCYSINLNSYNQVKRSVKIDTVPPEGEVSLSNSHIKCDSFDDINFFCIYYYKTATSWFMNYFYGIFNSIMLDQGNICSDRMCSYGNLISFKDLKGQKYLICYTKINFSSNRIMGVICQYIYIENNKVKMENTYNFWKDSDLDYKDKPIILYQYKNSLFILFDCKTSKMEYSRIILFSPDLKLNIDSNIFYAESSFASINLLNNDQYIYFIFQQGNTQIIERDLLSSLTIEDSIMLSNNNSYFFNFTFDSLNKDYVQFSMDDDLFLYINGESINTNEPIELSTLPYNSKFSFTKKNSPGIFDNYILFMKNKIDIRYQYFSLIKKITIIVCYESCQKCKSDEIGTYENNLCSQCIFGINYPKNDEISSGYYNCYKKDDTRIQDFYLDYQTNSFHKCNSTCKTCNTNKSCLSCKDNYYFIANENMEINPDFCYKELENKDYYFENNAGIHYPDQSTIVNTVYKKCFNSCSACHGKGTEVDNNCKECNSGFKKYAFSEQQCLLNKIPYYYWEFRNNNIYEISQCNNSVILYGENKGLCVEDCQNYKSPYLTTSMFFTVYNCHNQTYCVPLNICRRGEKNNQKFIINYENSTCYRTIGCNFSDIYESEDIFYPDTFPDPTDAPVIPNTTIIIPTEAPKKEIIIRNKTEEILTRAKIWRVFDETKKGGKFYDKFSNFDNNLAYDYIQLHNKEEKSNEGNGTGIYLVSTIFYNNFTINIYPLDIEDFVYNNVIIPNNLGFVNFTELLFPYFFDYENNTSLYIIVILLESKCENSSINDLNYYFFKFDEETEDFDEIKLSSNILKMNADNINIIYPLKNYYNNNSKLNTKNTEKLINTIKDMYKMNEKIELSNIDNIFYNDICELYTTEVNTDMSLNDRRDEFYVNESLCENNCTLNKIFDKDLKIIKALCKCNIKYNFTSNENAGKKFDIPHKSSYNIEAFLCIKETFNSLNLSKNIIFWVLLIVIIFFIVMLLCYIFYGNKILKRIFNLGSNLDTSSDYNSIKINKNSEIKIVENDELRRKESSKKNDLIIIPKVEKEEKSLSKISKIEKQDSIPSNENLNIIMNNNNNNINNINNINNNNVISKFEISKLDQEKNLNPNSAIISDNNNEKIEIKKKEKNSYKYNPPKKKKEEKKNDSMLTKTNNEEKDLISSDISFSKNYKNKENNNSEISFENISREKPVLIDNLLNNGEMLENNYLDYPLRFENNLILEMYRDALDLYNDEVDSNEINQILHHFKTMEDYYIPETKEKEKLGKKKLLKRKNPRIIKLLDGEDLFYPGEKNYESENYYEDDYHKKMNMNKKQYQESGEDTLLDNKLLIKNENKNIINKRTKNKNAKKDLIENSKQESENSEEKEIKLREKRKRKINFLQSLEKKDSSKKSDSKYGKEEDYKNARLKTDFEEDGKILVKSTLKYLGKEGLSSDENSSFSKNIKNKSFNSTINDKNNLFFSKNNLIIDDNLKPGKKHKILQLRDEEQIKKDKKNKKKKKQKRYIKNKKENSEIKESDEIKIDYNKASDFEIFYDKALGSSISSFMATGGDKAMIEENIFLYYWKYFKKRELFLVCFFDKKDTVPFFIRYSSFFFCLIFIFMINCFFFFEKNVHKRYINALEGKSNDISFYFKNEFVNTIYVALISIVFKMIIVKLVLNRAFKIKKKDKKMMHRSYEKKISESEFDDLEEKRIDYLIKYHIRMIIFFVLLFILSLFFSYICVSYGGVFKNSTNYFFFGLLFSVILSFAFCAVICFIIVGINKIARCLKNRCLLSTYVVFSTAY